jgi:hypothetical protein
VTGAPDRRSQAGGCRQNKRNLRNHGGAETRCCGKQAVTAACGELVSFFMSQLRHHPHSDRASARTDGRTLTADSRAIADPQPNGTIGRCGSIETSHESIRTTARELEAQLLQSAIMGSLNR